jgi:hypothetical protein
MKRVVLAIGRDENVFSHQLGLINVMKQNIFIFSSDPTGL